jgi:6,7-dimethyl-8-ribityllumazine synthase
VRQEEHARRRAAPGVDNKGAEAARAAVMTVLSLRAIRARGKTR